MDDGPGTRGPRAQAGARFHCSDGLYARTRNWCERNGLQRGGHCLLDPLRYPNADRLVSIAASAPGSERAGEFGVSSEFYLQYREEADLLEDVAMFGSFTSTLRVDDRVERVLMCGATPTLFSTLQVTPILGRLPVEEDESGVAVISHELWVMWFGADPDVIDKSYYIGGQQRTVIGVMGPDFHFPNDRVLLWIPNIVSIENIVVGRFGRSLIARMAPGVEHEELKTQLAVVAQRLPERFGGPPSYVRLIEQHRPVPSFSGRRAFLPVK